MAKPEIPESLQCLACAMRQEQGQVNETLLESYMLGIAGVRGGTQPPSDVMNALNIREDKVQNSWSTWPSRRADLDSYLTSCVLIANKIHDWLPTRKYIFHHANSLSSYKETYTTLAKEVYENTANNNVKAVYKEVSKGHHAEIDGEYTVNQKMPGAKVSFNTAGSVNTVAKANYAIGVDGEFIIDGKGNLALESEKGGVSIKMKGKMNEEIGGTREAVKT